MFIKLLNAIKHMKYLFFIFNDKITLLWADLRFFRRAKSPFLLPR